MKLILLAAALLGLASSPALAQDATKGEAVFKRCASCHAVGEGAKNKSGPHLNGLFGRQAGTLEGYKYSKAMVEAGANGLVWTPETFSEFIAKPRDYVKGTKMAFAGLKDETEISDLEAYLLQHSPDYQPAAPAAQ